ncbi:MAG: aspartate kinase [Bacteroidia bacterium]
MKIFKFGGASVKDANGVKNLTKVLSLYEGEKILVVVSAMGKTTNALERLTKAYFFKKEDPFSILQEVKNYHYEILTHLFEDKSHPVFDDVNNAFVEIEWAIEDAPTGTFDYEYDQIVSVGEILSTKIVNAYLLHIGVQTSLLDARDVIKTDNTYREGKINWEQTEKLANKLIPELFTKNNVIVTQGFIGGTSENFTTTLGREGSDYTAAILAWCLNAQDVTIWKDVPGVMNADPKWFDNTVVIDQISYNDAIELAYYGASVIHPKTIQPLQNKKIKLFVKSFINPQLKGTEISEWQNPLPIPSFIFKVNQMLISIMPKDFSFIAEENLRDIFNLFSAHRVKINVMQNTAISFSVCVDDDEIRIPKLIADLQKTFKVLYNKNVELATIRHYNQETIERVSKDKEILLELKSRNTVQLVMKNK